MSTTGRQNNLFLAEDWKKIYQTFKSADFQSYDFDNLRRVMIQYLREKYPEDFNDYIESSEYLALMDLIAFLGQSLSFRMDLNSRENFLELAERRESILRLAQLISYNPSRNVCANGLLKIEAISTSEELYDSAGRNLTSLEVTWNDPTNTNWYDQFAKIMSAVMYEGNDFGTPQTSSVIGNVYSEQYKLNTTISSLPIFGFSKVVNGVSQSFEIVSTVIRNGAIVEESPKRSNKINIIYRNDYKGYGSVNNGWFMHFRQGSLISKDFVINSPTTNEIVNIDDRNINQDDVWLYSLNSNNVEETLWTQVPSIIGNNIIYNSLDKTIRNIYKVQTRSSDTISLQFGDGIFANLPKGSFRVYYRTSNGTSYTINPKDIRGVAISIPYVSKKGTNEILRLTLSLRSSVTTATSAESNTEIKRNAPATYYTQNRMITGEDYNLAPLNVSQTIAKVKTINRTASGISRNFDLIDASGKYSSINTFCTDGILYREETENSFDFTFSSRVEIEYIITNRIEALIKSVSVRDFYYEKYSKIVFTDIDPLFQQATSGYNESTGYFSDSNDTLYGLPFKVGSYTGSILKYIEPGALVKFVPPTGYYFDDNGILVTTPSSITNEEIWAKVTSVVGDGTANGNGNLSTGKGPIAFNQNVPDGSIIHQIIPKFTNNLPTDTETLLVELIFNYKTFGLRYDVITRTWQIIYDRNLNLINPWSLGKAGDNTGQQLDSSWLVVFETDGKKYTVTHRGLEYYFESIKENRFFFDGTKKIYDSTTGKLVKDLVKILSFNTKPNSTNNLGRDILFEIIGSTTEEDGYASSRTVKLTFSDSNDDGIVDNPESFNMIVSSGLNRFVFFEKYITESYVEDYRYIENTGGKFLIFGNESDIGSLNGYVDGQLFYFYNTDIVKKFDKAQAKLVMTLDYFSNVGRNGLKFHYNHNADSTYRIDPSASNIMDTYLLTKAYDVNYRNWLKGNITEEPLPPSTTDLKITYGSSLDKIKSISDELIFHPVKYKVLFGEKAEKRFQASFKVVKNKEQVITDNDVKSRIIQAINEFFSIDNWEFGDTFFFTELSAYVMNQLTPFITTFLIVPTNSDQVFGSLQQITSAPNEIFISGASVRDIEIIDAITAAKINAQGYIITTTTIDVDTTNLKSSSSKTL